MFSIDKCMPMLKISIHLSSEMLTQKIRISIKRTVLIFKRKGSLKMHFPLKVWVQILAHKSNSGIYFLITNSAWFISTEEVK